MGQFLQSEGEGDGGNHRAQPGQKQDEPRNETAQ